MEYPVTLTRDGDHIIVACRDLPTVHTYGNSRPHALAMAADCLEEAIGAAMHLKRHIPAPSAPRRREKLVAVSPLVAAKAGLYQAMREAGVSQAELARRLDVDFQQVRQLLNLRVSSRIERLARAYEAVGKRLAVITRDAA